MIDLSPFDMLEPSAARRKTLAKGENLFVQGDRTHFLAHVQTGGLKLVRHTAGGAEIVVHTAGCGETVAEAAIFSAHYHCDCIATEDTEVTLIALAAVREAMRINPAFGERLLARLAGQVVSLRARLQLVAIASAKDRVFAAVSDGLHIGSIRTLAAQIQLSPEATNRALIQLVKEGRLQKSARGRYSLNGDPAPRNTAP